MLYYLVCNLATVHWKNIYSPTSFIQTGILDGCFANFSEPQIIPVNKVGSVYVAEMWHGPTGAFKDLALSIVGRLMDHFLKKRSKTATVLVSTSGDTGSAAIHSVLDSKNINIVVMYPRGRVSRVQELQRTTVHSSNVRVLSVDGTSDDQDVVMKKVNTDVSFATKYNITCLNSVNVARVLFQAVHFIYVYLQRCPEANHNILFCIPSGGLGNLAGGVIAREMGLPVKFLSAVNENDVVHRAFNQGELWQKDLNSTHSSAMDIQVPYNIERVLFYLSGQQSAVVKTVMESFESGKRTVIPPKIREGNNYITTLRVTNEDTLAVMQLIWKEHGYLLCPHTAVGMHALLKHKESNLPQGDCQDSILIATATAAKFPEVLALIGLPSPAVPTIKRLFTLAEANIPLEKGQDWEKIIKEVIASF